MILYRDMMAFPERGQSKRSSFALSIPKAIFIIGHYRNAVTNRFIGWQNDSMRKRMPLSVRTVRK
jgi:hypothetical protein